MKDIDFIFKARKHYKTLSDAEFDLKVSFVDDMKFAFNIDTGQWDSSDIDKRTKEGRPHLTMNKLSKHVALVVNDEKGQVNVDTVIPVDDIGDPDIAKIYNEIINDIEYQSNAEEIYNLAGEHAVGGGFGYWRIVTEYTDEGFDQEIKIKPIENPLMVSKDPRGNYAFIREALSAEEFENQYPNAEQIDFENYSGFDDYELWYEEDKIFVAEYFKKIPTTKEICEYEDPATRQLIIVEKTKENEAYLNTVKVVRKRKIDTHKIMWYKITGWEILEEQEWVGTEIPIIEVVGHKIHLKGKVYKKSLISDAKDGQRMYNYWLTSLTEKIALAPKAPFILTKQQISGHELDWKDANVKNHPYLLVNHTNHGIPARTPAPAVDVGAQNMLQIANSDVQDILGRYEASTGAPSNERSGKAIDARAARADMTTASFPDNLRKAKRETKKQIIKMIPKVYDNERVLRIQGTGELIPINRVQVLDGKEVKLHDLSIGRYDLRIKSPGSPSRRQQSVDVFREALQYAPDFAPVLLPHLLKLSDVTGSDEAAADVIQFAKNMPQEKKNG